MKKSIRTNLFIVPILAACNPFVKPFSRVTESRLNEIKLPEGFNIEVFADDIENARSMVLGEKGTLFVGTRTRGNVYAIQYDPDSYKAERVITIAKGLDSPNGVTYRDGDLYVAEISRIIKYPDIGNNLESPPEPMVINDDFPTDRHHGWKFIAFGPDDKLYVPVGAPCNICLPERDIYASITRMDPDGSNLEIYARGIRNTVGFTWNPEDSALWFTDNGRDWLGDNRPPDELNRAPTPGMNFGYPFCHAGDIPDPEFGKQHACSEFTPPIQKLGPHVAALGLIFYTGDMFPPEYKNQIFIAEHGSWNRTDPIGYRISLVRLEGNRAVSYTVFARGWLQGNQAWGRPVHILQLDDGSLLVSDDTANAIYRITYDRQADK